MSIDDDNTGLKSGCPDAAMPYSVSVPMTFGMAMRALYPALEVLPGADPVDLPTVAVEAQQRAHVHDALALLAGDPRPVVGVGRVGKVLVLLELVADRVEQVLALDALLAGRQEPLDRVLLGAAHDVLDHRAGVEVLEEQDLLVPRRVGDLEEPVLVGIRVHPVDRLLDHAMARGRDVAAVALDLIRVDRHRRVQVLGHHVHRLRRVRTLDLDLHVETPGAQDGGVDQVLTVGGADHDHVLEGLDAVELGQQLRHDCRLDVGGDARPAGAEDGVHLVEEHDDRQALFAPLLGADEDLADLALGLADVLVEQLGALHVEEVAARVVAPAAVGDLLGERLRDRLGDQRLAAAGRSVEQDALGRLELVLVEELGVQERQLDGIADQIDLAFEAADVLIAHIGDLLEDELLDLFAREQLGDHDGARVEQGGVTGAKAGVEQVAGHVRDVLVIAAAQDDRPVGPKLVLDLHDLARAVGFEDLDDVERLVQQQLRTRPHLRRVDVGRRQHAHLAAGRHDVHRAVVVGAHEHTERRGWLTELLDLFGEGADALPLAPQGIGELLVLLGRPRELVARLDELLLENGDLARRAGDTPAEKPDLLFQELHLGTELVGLFLVPLDLIVPCHRGRLLCSAGVYTHSLTLPGDRVRTLPEGIYGTGGRKA